jgi:hypothetical protein
MISCFEWGSRKVRGQRSEVRRSEGQARVGSNNVKEGILQLNEIILLALKNDQPADAGNDRPIGLND